MRDLLNQERPIAPAILRAGMNWLTLLLGVVVLVSVTIAIGDLFSGGGAINTLLHVAFSASLALAALLVVRLLVEIHWSLLRLNDRLMILADDLRRAQTPASPVEPSESA